MWEDHSTTFEGETDAEMEEAGDGEDEGDEAMVLYFPERYNVVMNLNAPHLLLARTLPLRAVHSPTR